MRREVILPSPVLAPYVRHIITGTFDHDRVHLPACADVQLLIYLKGGATLVDPEGSETVLPGVFLVGAVGHPRLYRVESHSRFIAVTFRPGGTKACLGLSAAELTGCIKPLPAAEHMQHALKKLGEADAPQALEAMLHDMLNACGGSAAPLPVLDPATLIQPVHVLARQLDISVRQFNRRCLDNLGMPLRDYRRLARYSAAMTALMMQGASPHSLAALAQEAGYVDQAHLTRDFSSMTGSPPGRLIKQRHAAPYEIWQFTRDELESYLN